jgi:hypothetical protein
MSITRGQLLGSIRTLCGEPADCPLTDGGLPSNLIFEVLTAIEDEQLRDLDLGSKSRRVQMEEVTLDEAQFAVNNSDFHAPSYAYLQTDPAADIWYPVEIVNHASLTNAAQNDVLAIGFYGSPQQAEVSWVPEAGQTLRLWYERSADDFPTLDGTTDLGALYDGYLKLQAAAQCRELMKLEVGDVLRSRLSKSEHQWQRYVNRSNQRGTGAKAPVNPFYRRTFPGLDPRRFFVPRR